MSSSRLAAVANAPCVSGSKAVYSTLLRPIFDCFWTLGLEATNAYIAAMSRAFVKEQDGAEAFDELPERLISEHPNLVTADGLVLIETEASRLSRAYADAQASGDRAALNAAAGDLRYWTARLASAEVVAPPADNREVRFGSRVTFARVDPKTSAAAQTLLQTYRIVGEDEADPAKGSISYVAPMARALMGKSVGEVIRVGDTDVEILHIS